MSSIRIDCGLVVGPSGCDDVVVDGVVEDVGDGKARGTTCASSSLRANDGLSQSIRVPRLQRGSEVVPSLL